MDYLQRTVVLGAVASLALPAHAATHYATSRNFKTVWSKVKAGDTLRLTGRFGATNFTWKKPTTAITIDATRARFTDSVKLDEVSGLKFLGGSFGSTTRLTRNAAIVVYGGSNISFDKPNIIGPNSRQGIFFSYTDGVSVTNGTFKNLGTAISLRGSTGSSLSYNKVTGSVSDGFQVYDSHKVKIDHNSCTGGKPRPTAHPDCVQLWSIRGNAPQSDIEISDNYASGATQGFVSFNAADGGGVRLSFLRNRVDSSYPQGVACYGCFDSKIIGNVVTTLRGAKSQTRINVIGGKNNIVSGNSIGVVSPKARSALAAFSSLAVIDASSAFAVTATDAAATAFVDLPEDDAMLYDDAVALSFVRTGGTNEAGLSVPEPGVWAMLIAGFGMIGVSLRRRPKLTTATA